MTLIVGGVGQGKLDYALSHLELGPDAVAHTPAEARERPVFAGLAAWVKDHPAEDLEELLAVNPDVTILCDEVGCGVIPTDPAERAWREAVGRLCCKLAARAQRVERIFCGLPMTLKGDGAWS